MSAEFDPYYQWLGIPPDERPIDHYRLLGIRKFENNPDVIENAADQRMSHIRTFQGGKHAQESQSILNQLSRARVCLLNPYKKSVYDQKLRVEAEAQAVAAGQSNLGAAPSLAPPPLQQFTPSTSPKEALVLHQ